MAYNGKMGDYVINGRTKVHNISIEININHDYEDIRRVPWEVDRPEQYFTQFWHQVSLLCSGMKSMGADDDKIIDINNKIIYLKYVSKYFYST